MKQSEVHSNDVMASVGHVYEYTYTYTSVNDLALLADMQAPANSTVYLPTTVVPITIACI